MRAESLRNPNVHLLFATFEGGKTENTAPPEQFGGAGKKFLAPLE
jgi:hypothetical protein